MTLNAEERDAVVAHRLEKARTTLEEVHGIIGLGYWATAANRLYYACFYAVGALLVHNGLAANTHTGAVHLLHAHFVACGKLSREEGRLYSRLFELRQTGDYDDWIELDASDVMPLVEPAADLIRHVSLLTESRMDV
jgi:uncharacterized protein (UPF0332 family)